MSLRSHGLKILLFPLFFISTVLMSIQLHAQTDAGAGAEQKKYGSEFGFHTGPYLPNQIDGMSEIQPVWGLRYGTSLRQGTLEIGAANSRANGVTYYNLSASYRYDVTLDDILGFVYTGLDVHQWSSPPTDATQTVVGGHVGGGMMSSLSDVLWFRSEMKFNLNPGTALYIGFGFVFRFPEGGGGGQ